MKTLTIRMRLALTMSFLAFMLLLVGAVGLLGMQKIRSSADAMSTDLLPSTAALASAEIRLARARLVLDHVAMEPNSPDAARQRERVLGYLDGSDKAFAEYMSLPQDAQESGMAGDLAVKRKALREAVLAFGAALDRANESEIRQVAMVALPKAYAEMTDASKALRDYQQTSADHQRIENAGASRTAAVVAIAAIAAGLIAAFAGWFLLRRAIMTPIAEALEHFEHISAGDLTRVVAVKTHDEMGQLLSGVASMKDKLAATVLTVRSSSEAIASASKQIAAGNTDLSSRTEEQAASLEETAASMEELRSVCTMRFEAHATGVDEDSL